MSQLVNSIEEEGEEEKKLAAESEESTAAPTASDSTLMESKRSCKKKTELEQLEVPQRRKVLSTQFVSSLIYSGDYQTVWCRTVNLGIHTWLI